MPADSQTGARNQTLILLSQRPSPLNHLSSNFSYSSKALNINYVLDNAISWILPFTYSDFHEAQFLTEKYQI